MIRPTALLCIALAGCGTGTSVSEFLPALGPAGVRAELDAPSSVHRGELLEVREDGLLILQDPGHHDVIPPQGFLENGQGSLE